MWAAEPLVAAAFVPASALAVFHPSWLASAAVQPVNALSFVTDGIHWGTRDYRYLRNAMLGATGLGCTLLLAFDRTGEATLFQVWLVTGGWIGVRGAFGLLRVWPGIGAAPLAGRR
jgi:MATE family multidrug resistance protein